VRVASAAITVDWRKAGGFGLQYRRAWFRPRAFDEGSHAAKQGSRDSQTCGGSVSALRQRGSARFGGQGAVHEPPSGGEAGQACLVRSQANPRVWVGHAASVGCGSSRSGGSTIASALVTGSCSRSDLPRVVGFGRWCRRSPASVGASVGRARPSGLAHTGGTCGNRKKATAAVMRYGCWRGEFVEGYEPRCGEAYSRCQRTGSGRLALARGGRPGIRYGEGGNAMNPRVGTRMQQAWG